jgi:hypothetical protein
MDRVDCRVCGVVAVAVVVLAGWLSVEPAFGSTATVELGATAGAVTVPCPRMIAAPDCAGLLAGSTAIQTVTGGVPSPMKVRHAGRLVAFHVGLAQLSEAQLGNLLRSYGGERPRVEITVLRPVRVGGKRAWRVAAHSRAYPVQTYLGTVKRISLRPAIPLSSGQVIALTVPTWAPVLTYGLAGPRFQWRAGQSQTPGDCTEPALDVALLTIGATSQFECSYTGGRVEYSATEVEQ